MSTHWHYCVVAFQPAFSVKASWRRLLIFSEIRNVRQSNILKNKFMLCNVQLPFTAVVYSLF